MSKERAYLYLFVVPNQCREQVVSLQPVDDLDGGGKGGMAVGEDGAKYPYR